MTQASLRRCRRRRCSRRSSSLPTPSANNIRYGRPDATDAGDRAGRAARRRSTDDITRHARRLRHLCRRARRHSSPAGRSSGVSIARLFPEEPADPDPGRGHERARLRDRVERIQNALDTLCPRAARCIIIAHRLSTVQGADRVAVIDGARVCEQGTPAELIARDGKYAALCRAQHLISNTDATDAERAGSHDPARFFRLKLSPRCK